MGLAQGSHRLGGKGSGGKGVRVISLTPLFFRLIVAYPYGDGRGLSPQYRPSRPKPVEQLAAPVLWVRRLCGQLAYLDGDRPRIARPVLRLPLGAPRRFVTERIAIILFWTPPFLPIGSSGPTLGARSKAWLQICCINSECEGRGVASGVPPKTLRDAKCACLVSGAA
jgi:hypothetical protein